MLRRSAPEEPEWYRTATRSVLLAEEAARTDSRQQVLAQQQAYEEQQRLAQQARAQQQAQAAYAHQQPGAQHAGAQQQASAAWAHQQAQHAAWLQQQSYTAHYVPAQAQANPTPRPTLRTWLLGGTVVVGSLVLALIFALYFGLSFGILTTLIGLVFALIPLAIVVPIFLWLDRFEAEPWRYLVTAFLYGALGSTLISLVLNTIGGVFLLGVTDPESANVLGAVIVAPLVEETFKGVFLLVMWWFMRKEFNGLTDGIVYAGIVAAGFAFTENILYLGRALTEGGTPAFVVTFVLRGIISPFLHPMFTTMTGIAVGMAALSRSTPVKVVAPIIGWCAAVLLHGLWNLSASSGTTGLILGLCFGFVAFVSFVAFVIWTRSREGKVIGEHLLPYADSGWISRDEVAMLASMKERRVARRWARASGGAVSLQSMRAFQDSASELALLRFRKLRHEADHDALQQERVLLDSMTARRREFAGA
ncbi:PrsW family glutamic-type intramembrane protease [Janibacter sp. CX7]|jgi:RsiW-degrading membrane proteinase PrsW (M82 family)|uniref:PrsW family intramembrane metalloprotease n=1 Tax=Janibacter sp. CX7 TaxID=2963431 RepID=UPI0020CBE194|nr:PrsW family glutamic-type intramembrane protease [Janibacter sp. CX7]UTT65170.1 PrsW family glutamic-type intramembrane protease [Janibacter sp. CX7]